MSNAQSLNDHYRLLLGLDKDWDVERVDLQMAAKRVSIHLRHVRGVALSLVPLRQRLDIKPAFTH